jgi:hypothetical protein
MALASSELVHIVLDISQKVSQSIYLMPNWCFNTLSVDGAAAAITKFRSGYLASR